MSIPAFGDNLCDIVDRSGSGALDIVVKPFLNLAGFGGFIKSPYEELQEKLQKINDEIQTVNNTNMLAFSKRQGEIDIALYQEMQLISQEITTYINYNNVIINEKLSLDSIYISGTFLILIVFLLFYLSTPLKPK